VNRLNPHRNTLLLAAIFLLCATSTVMWTVQDKTPPSWDPSHHIVTAYDYYRPLGHLDLRGFVHEFFQTQRFYAPLMHLITAFVFLIFGASRLSGIAINFISLAVLLASVAWIGRRLYGSEAAREHAPTDAASSKQRIPDSTTLTLGALAALLATSYHFPAWLLHDAFLDYPLIAIVTLSFALLIHANEFTNRRDAIRFAIVAGLGILLKQTFVFFFVLPALYVTIRVLLKRDWKAMRNLALAGVIIAAIAAIWYVPHFRDTIEIYRINQQGAIDEHEPPVFSRDSLLYYLHSLISMQMQMPLGILFGIGLLYSLIRCRKESRMLYLWLASGIGIFTLIANKDVRYTIPVLPAAALLSVCWLREFSLYAKRKAQNQPVSDNQSPSPIKLSRRAMALKLALVAPIAAWAVVSFFNAQWPAPGTGAFVDTPYFRWMVFNRNYFGYDHRPLPDSWSVPEVVRVLAEYPYDENSPSVHAMKEPKPLRQKFPSLDPHELDRIPREPYDYVDLFVWPTLGVVVNRPFLNSSACALYARFFAPERAGMPVVTIESIGSEAEMERLPHCDFLLVRTGLDHVENPLPVELEVEALIRANPQRFTRVAVFPTPVAGSNAEVYRCW